MCAVVITNPVTDIMRQRKVPPLPRNYELFYEAVVGSNPKLSAELAALGAQPFQDQLDELFNKYIGQLKRGKQIDVAQDNISTDLAAILGLLAREKDALSEHGSSLGGLRDVLANQNAKPVAELAKAIADVKTMTQQAISVNASAVAEAETTTTSLQEMRRKLNEYKRLAYIDSLTGLFNRRAFDDRIAATLSKYRQQSGCALILADIDHFKRFNDTYGHPVGDKVLVAVAQTLAKFANRNIFVARPGGEEFALIVENMSLGEATRLADLVRQDVAKIAFDQPRGTTAPIGPVTISLGVSATDQATDGVEFYQNSDLALYASKNSGRNRTTAYSAELSGQLSNNRMIYRKAI